MIFRILLSEINQEKIQFARNLGFEVYGPEELCSAIERATCGKGVDVVIEGTGSSGGLNTAIEMVRTFGNIVFLGNPMGDTVIKKANHSQILRKELNLLGIWNSVYASAPMNEWEYTVKLLDNKLLKVDDLITHRVSLEELPELMENIKDKNVNICKAIYKNS